MSLNKKSILILLSQETERTTGLHQLLCFLNNQIEDIEG